MALRLTLRTLLAYLDDTLGSAEIKDIGQKVAESDAAQELIARIKQVTRRRRLTVPPHTGPGGMDPNDVAEYLDNVLPSERLTEVEKSALESDVHLAEVAACHQILTLVLGEPALVPPRSKERMYGLVTGREAIPYRKAQAPKKTGEILVRDDEDLGLSAGWLRWVLPVAGLLLILALGLAIYQVLPSSQDNRFVGGPTPPTTPGKDADKDSDPKDKTRDNSKTKDNGKTRDDGKPVNPQTKQPDPPEKDKDGKGGEPTPPQPPTNPPGTPGPDTNRPGAPNPARKFVGSYRGGYTGLPTVLLSRQDATKEEWIKHDPRTQAQVNSSDTLVTLPGFTSVIETPTGVGLLMRGNVRDFHLTGLMDYLLDSAVVLHASDNYDLDLTLLRGRIFLTNRKDKGPCKIRLRFEKEVWDVTLGEKGDEVGVDLLRWYMPTINYMKGEEPRAQCYLAALRGDITLKVDALHTFNMEVESPAWKWMAWDSTTGTSDRPTSEAKLPPAWSKLPPSPDLLPDIRQKTLKGTLQALKDLETLLASPKKAVVALNEMLEKPDPMARILAVYGLTAIDEVGKVIDVLNDGDPAHAPDREAAYYSLQRWISRGPGQGLLLYTPPNDKEGKKESGLLIDKGYKKGEAQGIYQLLYPIPVERLGDPETYIALANSLRHRKPAIAELGYWHLVFLSFGTRLPPGFNAAYSIEEREKYSNLIMSMIEKKQIPPSRERSPMEKEKDK